MCLNVSMNNDTTALLASLSAALRADIASTIEIGYTEGDTVLYAANRRRVVRNDAAALKVDGTLGRYALQVSFDGVSVTRYRTVALTEDAEEAVIFLGY